MKHLLNMTQIFSLKVFFLIIFFRLKGFKILKKDNLTYLVDKKRWLLISKVPKEDQLNFRFDKEIIFKNPKRTGFFKVGHFSPHVCLLFV